MKGPECVTGYFHKTVLGCVFWSGAGGEPVTEVRRQWMQNVLFRTRLLPLHEIGKEAAPLSLARQPYSEPCDQLIARMPSAGTPPTWMLLMTASVGCTSEPDADHNLLIFRDWKTLAGDVRVCCERVRRNGPDASAGCTVDNGLAERTEIKHSPDGSTWQTCREHNGRRMEQPCRRCNDQ